MMAATSTRLGVVLQKASTAQGLLPHIGSLKVQLLLKPLQYTSWFSEGLRVSLEMKELHSPGECRFQFGARAEPGMIQQKSQKTLRSIIAHLGLVDSNSFLRKCAMQVVLAFLKECVSSSVEFREVEVSGSH